MTMNDLNHFNWLKQRQLHLRQETLKDPHALHRLLLNYTSFYPCPGKLAEGLRDSVLEEQGKLYELFTLAISWQAQQDYQLLRDSGIWSVIELLEQTPPAWAQEPDHSSLPSERDSPEGTLPHSFTHLIRRTL